MATQIWVNIVSGNGLVHEGTKPLPEQMLIHCQRCSLIFLIAISEDLIGLIRTMYSGIALPHSVGTNELTPVF